MQYSIAVLLTVTVMATAAGAEDITTLDELEVTARPPGFQSLEHIAQPATILRGEELAEKQTTTIGETLALEPGVSASDFGQGASRPIIRGLGGPRLRILQGGIGSLDVSSLSVDHAVSVNPMHADQIEILRGPATLLYGSGNSAGLVNIVTNRIPESIPEASASLDTRIESARFGPSVGFEVEGGADNLALHLDTFHQNTDDYEAADGEILNSEVEISDFNLGGSMIGDRGYFGISFGRYQSLYEIPFNPEEPDELVFIDLDQNRFDFAGRLTDPFPGFSNATFRGAYNDYQHTEFEGPGEPGTFFKNNEREGRLELNHKPVGPFTGLLGLQYQQRDFTAVGEEAFVGPAERDSIGIFLFEDTDIGDWHFEIGGRFEHTSNDGVLIRRGGAAINADFDVYSLSAGTTWNTFNDFTLAVSATRAQRAPAIEELFADGPHLATETFEEGNPDLKEEISNNLDLGLRKSAGRWTWSASIFVNYIEDFIFLQNLDENVDGVADRVDEDRVLGAGDLQLVTTQQEDAIFYGTEFESTLGLREGKGGNLDLRVFGDWVRARLDSGEDLPRISPARLGAGLSWKKNSWKASLEGIQVFGQEDSAPLETDTGGYFLLNAGAVYTPEWGKTSARLFLRATNLLDEDARRHTSFLKDRAPLPGRSIMLGLNLAY